MQLNGVVGVSGSALDVCGLRWFPCLGSGEFRIRGDAWGLEWNWNGRRS